MKFRHPLLLGLALASLAFQGDVIAADIARVYKGLPVSSTSPDGFYVWLDSSYQSINLPTYGLGWVNKNATNGAATGPSSSFDPRATGVGFAGAAGYIFKDGIFAPAYGSRVRIELGLSYVDAEASETGTGIASPHLGLQAVNGAGLANALCASCLVTPSILTTDYRSWQLNLKGASDFTFDALTLTPSVTIFGGNSRNHQNLAQQLSQPFLGNLGTYSLSSKLDWTDWGAKIGLNTVYRVTKSFAIGLGGGIGVAARNVDLAANDVVNSTGFLVNATSSLARTTDTTAFLANAETNLTFKPWSGVALRGFAGLNFDSRVPGIAAPTYATFPPFTGATGITGTNPASIYFDSEVSFYVGGGLTVKFGPDTSALASIR